jgi:CRP-like cAMP-binding protein
MASKSAKLNALTSVPLFSDCSKRELGHIVKVSRTIEVEPGTVIVDQGQMGAEAFIILEGEVTVRRGGRKIASLGIGDVVGELSLLDHGPRTASVVADGDAKLLVLAQNEFRDVLHQHPSIAFKLLGTLAERIREFDRKYYG